MLDKLLRLLVAPHIRILLEILDNPDDARSQRIERVMLDHEGLTLIERWALRRALRQVQRDRLIVKAMEIAMNLNQSKEVKIVKRTESHHS